MYLFIYFAESPGDGTTDDGSAKELQELRDRYEGKVTASLYTGTLFVAAAASLGALVALCVLHFNVSAFGRLIASIIGILEDK